MDIQFPLAANEPAAEIPDRSHNVLKKSHQAKKSKGSRKKPANLILKLFGGSSSKSESSSPDMRLFGMDSPNSTSVNDEEVEPRDRLAEYADLINPSPLQHPTKGGLQARWEGVARSDRPLAVSNSLASLSPLSHQRNIYETLLDLTGQRETNDLTDQETGPMEVDGQSTRAAHAGVTSPPTRATFFSGLWDIDDQPKSRVNDDQGSESDMSTQHPTLRRMQGFQKPPATFIEQEMSEYRLPTIPEIARKMDGNKKNTTRTSWLCHYYQGNYNCNDLPYFPQITSDSFCFLPALDPRSEAERLVASQKFDQLWLRRTSDLLTALQRLTEDFDPDFITLSTFGEGQEILVANSGFDVDTILRAESLAAHAMYTGDVMVVLDTKEDWRFQRNPYVLSYPHVRFFAATPLLSSEGQIIAVLSIYGKEPRGFDIVKRQELSIIGREIMDDIYRTLNHIGGGPSRLQYRLSRHLETAPARVKSRLSQFIWKEDHKHVSVIDPGLIPQALNIRKITEEPTPPPSADSEMGPGPDVFHGFGQCTAQPSDTSYFMNLPGDDVCEEPGVGHHPYVDSVASNFDQTNRQKNMDHPPAILQPKSNASHSSLRSTAEGTDSSHQQGSVADDTRHKQHHHQGSAPATTRRKRLSISSENEAANLCRKTATDLKYDLIYVVGVAGIEFVLADGTFARNINAAIQVKSSVGTIQGVSKESIYEALHLDQIKAWAVKGDSLKADDLTSGDLMFIHSDEKVPAKQRSSGFVLVALRTELNKHNRAASRFQETMKLNKLGVDLRKFFALPPAHQKTKTNPYTGKYPANEATEVVVHNNTYRSNNRKKQ